MWVALAVSEVLFLCEQHDIDTIIIGADVEQWEMIEKQLRGIVMRVQKNVDAAYLDSGAVRSIPKTGHDDPMRKTLVRRTTKKGGKATVEPVSTEEGSHKVNAYLTLAVASV